MDVVVVDVVVVDVVGMVGSGVALWERKGAWVLVGWDRSRVRRAGGRREGESGRQGQAGTAAGEPWWWRVEVVRGSVLGGRGCTTFPNRREPGKRETRGGWGTARAASGAPWALRGEATHRELLLHEDGRHLCRGHPR